MASSSLNGFRKVGLVFGILVIVPLVLALLPLMLVARIVYSLVLRLAIIAIWIPRGIRYLVVYSDSEQWKGFFELEALPLLGTAARSIDLSTDGGKKAWWNLDWRVYQYAGGWQNRFPIVCRVSFFGGVRVVRFYDAFMEAKRGRAERLVRAKGLFESWVREDRHHPELDAPSA